MTYVAPHVSHIWWEGNLATLYGSIQNIDNYSLRNSPPAMTLFEDNDASVYVNSA